MKQSVGSGLLVDIVHTCTVASDESVLFKGVLPEVRELAEAEIACVISRGPDGLTISYAAGPDLTAEALELPAGISRGIVETPASWVETGIGHVFAQALAGHLGTLAIGWRTRSGSENPAVSAALDAIAGAAARLTAEADLADLVLRVDSAQHLAAMGDYDWHIPTDTNKWSDQLYRIYGYEPQSFNASYEKFLSCLHPDDRERIQGVHQQAYATGEPYQMIERIVRPDGEVRYLSSNGEVIMDGSGAPVRMRGTCIDVTERILAEQEQEQIRERFRGLVEASPDAILVFDADGRILQANTRAVDLLGGEPTGRRVGEILPSSNGGQAVAAVRLDGQDLLLDVTTAELSETDQQRRTAAFLMDAKPRLEREAMATRLGELQQRRRQALEINDNIVQGLSSAYYALDSGDLIGAESYVGRTLKAARNMMDDLLEPNGQHLVPGDLVRSRATALEPRTTQSAEDDPLEPGGEAHRILIVDDADDIRMLLRLKISSHDAYDVVGEAIDGEDAVEQARTLQPNLVLLDMAMPRMDGLQALPLIHEAVPGVRVIVLSGFNQGTLEQEAIAAGADRYVVKGGPMKELLQIIAEVLDAR